MPHKLVLMAFELVSPGKNQLRSDVLDESWLEVIQLERAVGTVVKSQGVVCSELYLFKFQTDSLVDAIDKF